MATMQLATRIDAAVKNAVTKVCKSRGWKINRFVEEALLDKLEELEDLEDLQALREEPARPLRQVLEDLRAHGKL
jgi:hypothetical protein